MFSASYHSPTAASRIPDGLQPPDSLQHMLHNWHNAEMHCLAQRTGHTHSHWGTNTQHAHTQTEHKQRLPTHTITLFHTQTIWLSYRVILYMHKLKLHCSSLQRTVPHTPPYTLRLLTPGRLQVAESHGRQQTLPWSQTALHTEPHCCNHWAETESSPMSQTLNLDQSPPLAWRQMAERMAGQR